MQNKENGFGRFVKEKGYYIVLLLCAVAIGVSGYLLLSGKNSDQQVHLSTERATVPPGVRATEHAENVVATDGPEPGTEATEPTLRLQPPVAGEQTGGFAADHLAYNATTRDWRTHEGLDLAAALGDPVCAAADGTVYTIYEDERYGTTVVLRHSGGFTTHYANLSEEPEVAVGDTVRAGQRLGTVGQTALTVQATRRMCISPSTTAIRRRTRQNTGSEQSRGRPPGRPFCVVVSDRGWECSGTLPTAHAL